MRTLTKAAVAATLAFCAAGVSSFPAVAEPPAPAPATPKSAIDTDGTFTVNTDIVPGTYATAGPVGDGVCYWKRADGTGTTLDNAMTKKPQVVAITPTDATFKTTGCQAWQLTDQAPPSEGSPQLNGLKMQGYLALINGMAGMAGPVPPPPPPDPAAGAPGPAPGPAPAG